MAHLKNYSQQQDLLDEEEMTVFWAWFVRKEKDEEEEENQVGWTYGLGVVGKEVEMTLFLKNNMADGVFRLISEFLISEHPKTKIPWNCLMDKRAFFWEVCVMDYFKYPESEEVADIFDRPYCHKCGEPNKQILFNGYRACPYAPNRARMCKQCLSFKAIIRNVLPNYKIWRSESSDCVKYGVSHSSFSGNSSTIFRVKQYSANLNENRIIYEYVKDCTFVSMVVMKVSCNYREWYKGRPIFDHWIQSYFLPNYDAGEDEYVFIDDPKYQVLMLRRTYVPLGNAGYHHQFEEATPCTLSRLTNYRI